MEFKIISNCQPSSVPAHAGSSVNRQLSTVNRQLCTQSNFNTAAAATAAVSERRRLSPSSTAIK